MVGWKNVGKIKRKAVSHNGYVWEQGGANVPLIHYYSRYRLIFFVVVLANSFSLILIS